MQAAASVGNVLKGTAVAGAAAIGGIPAGLTAAALALATTVLPSVVDNTGNYFLAKTGLYAAINFVEGTASSLLHLSRSSVRSARRQALRLGSDALGATRRHALGAVQPFTAEDGWVRRELARPFRMQLLGARTAALGELDTKVRELLTLARERPAQWLHTMRAWAASVEQDTKPVVYDDELLHMLQDLDTHLQAQLPVELAEHTKLVQLCTLILLGASAFEFQAVEGNEVAKFFQKYVAMGPHAFSSALISMSGVKDVSGDKPVALMQLLFAAELLAHVMHMHDYALVSRVFEMVLGSCAELVPPVVSVAGLVTSRLSAAAVVVFSLFVGLRYTFKRTTGVFTDAGRFLWDKSAIFVDGGAQDNQGKPQLAARP